MARNFPLVTRCTDDEQTMLYAIRIREVLDKLPPGTIVADIIHRLKNVPLWELVAASPAPKPRPKAKIVRKPRGTKH